MDHTLILDLQVVVYPDGSWAILKTDKVSTVTLSKLPKKKNYSVYVTRTLLPIPLGDKPEGVRLRRVNKTPNNKVEV